MRHVSRPTGIAALFLLVFGGGVLFAGPIHYDEAVDGPLPRHPNIGVTPEDFLTLGIGLNTITGTAQWLFSGPTTFDTAPLILPEGMQITSIHLSTFKSGGDGLLTVTLPALVDYDEAFHFVTFIDRQFATMPFEDSLFDAFLPLDPGNYGLCMCGFGGGLEFGEFTTNDYTWSVRVASTPEPALAWLFATGLGFAVWRRRG